MKAKKNKRERRGQPVAYTPEELRDKFDAYTRFCKDNPLTKQVASKHGITTLELQRPLTIVGFCKFAEISRQTLLDYGEREEYFGVITHVREVVESDQLEGAIVGIYDAAIVTRVLRLAEHHDITSGGASVHDAPTINVSYNGESISLTNEDVE